MSKEVPHASVLSALFYRDSEVCWLRWLSVPQRLTMLEELMRGRGVILTTDLRTSCVTEYWVNRHASSDYLLAFFFLAIECGRCTN